MSHGNETQKARLGFGTSIAALAFVCGALGAIIFLAGKGSKRDRTASTSSGKPAGDDPQPKLPIRKTPPREPSQTPEPEERERMESDLEMPEVEMPEVDALEIGALEPEEPEFQPMVLDSSMDDPEEMEHEPDDVDLQMRKFEAELREAKGSLRHPAETI